VALETEKSAIDDNKRRAHKKIKNNNLHVGNSDKPPQIPAKLIFSQNKGSCM
jgi:hypothetical protein